MVELLNTNCREYMATLPDKAFDLSIVDPPYGIKQDGRKNHTRGKLAKPKDYRGMAKYDDSPPDAEYFKELFRISKNQIIWGGNYFIDNLRATPCFIVWDKDNTGDFADCELAWTSFDTAVRKFKYRWNGMLQERMDNKEERIHPNQKPVELYRWLLHNYAKEGDRIFDTHLGSGSSAIAAHKMGFDFVGCELDEEYYKDSLKRFKEQTAQLSLL